MLEVLNATRTACATSRVLYALSAGRHATCGGSVDDAGDDAGDAGIAGVAGIGDAGSQLLSFPGFNSKVVHSKFSPGLVALHFGHGRPPPAAIASLRQVGGGL
jgi:hypothetical protein